MSIKQIITVILLTFASFLALGHIENFTFGLMDNAPMLVLMIMGLDPDGWLGDKLEKYNLNPAILAAGVAMFVNTFTDGLAAGLDANASFFGVVLGCLVPILFLPVIARMQTKTDATPEILAYEIDGCGCNTNNLYYRNAIAELERENLSLKRALDICPECDGAGEIQGFDSFIDCQSCN